jgi:mRNA interferase MazF
MRYNKGDIVLVDFTFFDSNISKKRLACVLIDDENEVVLAEITSKSRGINDILIKKQDFKEGELREDSWLWPLRLSTFHKSKISFKIGHLKENKINEIVGVICGFLRR